MTLPNLSSFKSLSNLITPPLYLQAEGEKLAGESEKDKLINGRWTKPEHKLFVEALNIYGKNWNKVATYVKTRNATQVRSHAQKYFLRCTSKPTQDKSNASSSSTEHSRIMEKISTLEKTNEKALGELRILLESGIALHNNLKIQEELIGISKEAMELLIKVAEDPKATERCLKISNASNLGYIYLTNKLKEPKEKNKECGFLMKHMQNYGFKSFNQLTSTYIKLSDWVDTSIGRKD